MRNSLVQYSVLDINNVFSNGDFLEEVYMQLSLVYPTKGGTWFENSQNPFVGLDKHLDNGFKNSPPPLSDMVPKNSSPDHSLFTMVFGPHIQLVYVDDIIIAEQTSA